MGLIETVKDALTIIQKTDNLDLYRQVLDIQREAMDQQEEMRKLRAEIHELKEQLKLKGKIVRHREPVITIDDDEKVVYCATCYGKDGKYIQMKLVDDYYYCPACKMSYIRRPFD